MTVPDRQAIEQFLFLEARLQDEHRYDEWEALWTDDALYWVPIGDDPDPDKKVSVIYDNRARLASRIRQLKTGRRQSQSPPSRMRRVISNIEITPRGEGIEVVSNFVLFESRRGTLNLWAGQTHHKLRAEAGTLKLVSKKVLLVNSDEAIPNLSFLI